MSKLIALVERMPGAVIGASSWGYHHPAALVVLGMASLTVGAFTFVSAHFHRRER